MKPTGTRYSLAAARQAFATLLARAALGGERFMLTRRGIDIAALIGARDIMELERLDAADATLAVWDPVRPPSPRAAREQLADRLLNVEAGQRVAIEKRGRVYAGLVPVQDLDRLEARAAIQPIQPRHLTLRAETVSAEAPVPRARTATVSAILTPADGPALVVELKLFPDDMRAQPQTLVEVRSAQTPRLECHEHIVEAIQAAAMMHAQYGPTPAGFTYELSFDRSRDTEGRSLADVTAQVGGASIQAPAFLATLFATIGCGIEPDVLATGPLNGPALGSIDRKVGRVVAADIKTFVAPKRDRETIRDSLDYAGLTLSGDIAHGQFGDLHLLWFDSEAELYEIARELCGQSAARRLPPVPREQPTSGPDTVGALWYAVLLGSASSLGILEQSFMQHLERMSETAEHAGPALSRPLTQLQQEFMSKRSDPDNALVSDCHLLVSGGTSSGKTTLLEILSVATALSDSRRSKVLYIAPTRALAQLRHVELNKRYGTFRQFSPTGRRPIIIATGEDNTEDWRLRSGDFSIGVLVYEKANVLAQIQRSLLDKVGLIVIDEAHMLADLDRGPMLEMFLLKALHRRGEQERTAEERGNQKLRIAVISTEALHADQMMPHPLVDLLSETKVLTGRRSLPIVIAQPFRPGKIVHQFILPKRDSPGHFRVPIAEFHDAVSRTLSLEQIAQAEAEIYTREERYFNSLGDLGRRNISLFKNEPADRLFSLLKWMHEHYRGAPRRVLIFMPSIQAIKSISNRLKKSLSAGTQQLIDPDLQSEFDDLDDVQEMKSFSELAAAGIFIHHAGVDRQLRDKIANLWSQPHAEGPVQFLFATETLSFGVNLSVDDVVMYGTRVFSSPRNRNNEGVRSPYSPCEFHNMIGRAGRLGLRDDSKTANVYVLPAGEDQAREILRSYYFQPVGLRSGLFVEDDVVLDRGGEAESKVNNLSHAFVHAMLDLLRYLTPVDSAAVSVEEMTEALEAYSLFCRQIVGEPGAVETLKRLRHSIETVLEGCVAGPDDIRLVVKVPSTKPARFRLTQKGRDVLDTGTEIQTLLPLTLLTIAIEREAWLAETQGEEPMPGELALLAVLAQRECFRSVQKTVPEARLETQPHSKLVAANESGVFELFAATLDKLVSGSSRGLATRLSDIVHRFCCERNIARPDLRRDAILRVYTMMLLWIDGRRLQEARKPVEILYPRAEQHQFNPNVNSFSERLSWKLELLSRLLAPKHEPGLTDMVARVRMGCPSDAVTLLNAFPGLKRVRASTLARNGGAPDDLLRFSGVDLSAQGLTPASQAILVTRLRDSVARAFNELIAEMSNRPGAKPSKHVNAVGAFGSENLFSSDIRAFFGERGFALPTHLFDEIARTYETDFWSADGDLGSFEEVVDNVLWAGDGNGRTLEMIPDENSRSFLLNDREDDGDSHTAKLLVLGTQRDWTVTVSGLPEGRPFSHVLTEEAEQENLVICATPWLPHPSEWPAEVIAALQTRRAMGKRTVFLTGPALCVLLVLLGREFETPNALLYTFMKPGEVGVITVRDLREKVIGVPEFPGAIRRAMAKFKEVGTSIPPELQTN